MSEKKESLQQAADKVVNQQVSIANQNAGMLINDVFENLVVRSKVDNAYLPEKVFKEHFLPFFSGEQTVKDNKDIISEWVGIAGSPMAEVNIVDNDGSTLFTVPPMFDSSVIETAKRNLGESFSDIYSQYKLHSNHLPVVGESYLAKAFEKKIGQTVKKSEMVASNQQRWNDILGRYGKTSMNPTTNARGSININDELDYD